ncbi:MAG: contractile injection system tape measure protein [Algibacter sp.]
MIKNQKHIIASCHWDTFFNDKDKGAELQNAISHWSDHHMSREISTIFNTICPENQTLKIKTLEVDLGVINYENCIEELTLKLKEKLYNKLNDIVMFPNKHGQSIEIIEDKDSSINVLKHYFLQGVMPWNYYKIKGSVNQILENEMSNNTDDVIRMIQVVGDKQYVRRRMAWQFKDTSLKRIIETIEKNNHSYIIDFSEEFIKIQEQEAIVKTSTHDFKKNLWFWILNYLFVERGTMFNKVEFVRNTIQQMANHYNIGYDILYSMIEDAVHKIKGHSYAKTNFILILSILSKRQSDIAYTKFSSKRQLEKNWELLQSFFKSPTNCTTSHQKKRFNELIDCLPQIDNSRFKKMIESLDDKSFIWQFTAINLKPFAFESLLSVLSPSKEKTIELVNQIRFFSQLKRTNLFKLDAGWVKQIGLQFLRQDKSTLNLSTEFLKYVVKQLSQSHKISKRKVLESLASLDIPVGHKNLINLEIFEDLKQIQTKESSNQGVLFSEKRLITILKRLNVTTESTLDQRTLENHYKLICIWIKAQPIIVWDILILYKDKFNIEHLISHVLELENIAVQLLEKKYPKTYKIITGLEERVDKLIREEKSLSTIAIAIKKCLAIESMQLVLIDDTLSSYSFLEFLLVRLKGRQGIGNTSGFHQSISKILEDYNFDKLDISESQQIKLQQFTNKGFERSDLEILIANMGSSNKQNKVAILLGKLIHTKQINTSEFKLYSREISDYLFKNGDTLQLEFIKKYTPKFKSLKYTAIEIEQKILESYWQCIVDYDRHQGDRLKFSKLFEEAIAYYFIDDKGIENNQKINFFKEYKETANTSDYVIKVSTSEFITKLKEGLINPEAKIKLDGNTIKIERFVLHVLEKNPHHMRTFFKETVLSSKKFAALQNIMSLEQFLALITRDKPNSLLSYIYEAIHVLYIIVQELDVAQLSRKIKHKLFEYSLELLKSSTVKKEDLNKIVVYVFNELTQLSDVNSAYILKQIQQKNIVLPDILKETLKVQNPNFKSLSSITIKETISDDLQACISKNKFETLCAHLLKENKIPFWFSHKKSCMVKDLINDMLIHQPLRVLTILREKNVSETQLIRLSEHIEISKFVPVLEKLYPSNKNQFTQLEKLHDMLGSSSIKGISPIEMQQLVLKKMLSSWKTSNWKIINTSNIWQELLWEICAKRNIEKKCFFEAFDFLKIRLPIALQISYQNTFRDKKTRTTNNLKIKKEDKPLLVTEIMDSQNIEIQSTGIDVPNAGLVLLNTYFPMLFERLELLKDKQFVSEDARINAVHYLQYVVTGLSHTEESLLTLNKIICGIALQQPIKDSIEISDKEKTLIEGLLKSAMGYWEAIGSSSVLGFRGNWLVRNGVLREEEDRWSLTVEKRPYDVLLIKSPFSFSIIKFPWMQKPLHITWPY